MAPAGGMGGFWQAAPAGVTLRIRVQPRAKRAGLQGVAPAADGPRLRLALTEPPEDGKANRAACAAVAQALGVAPSAVAVVQGAASREKTLAVAGDPAALGAILERLA